MTHPAQAPTPSPSGQQVPEALPFKRVLILGLGLLGGSFGLALQKAGCRGTLWGQDNDPDHLAQALELGLVHRAWERLEAPEPFDLVFLAVPSGQIQGALLGLAPWLRADTLILDACSVKEPVIAALEAALGWHPAFLPSHPIAGSHLSGPQAGREDLFQGATVVVTPTPALAPGALQLGTALWRSLGAVVRHLSPEAHDESMGLLSHLPQLLVFTYAQQVLQAQADLTLAGPGFRDFTRLAHSSAPLWADIALANRRHLLPMLAELRTQLAALSCQLEAGDREALEARFQGAGKLA